MIAETQLLWFVNRGSGAVLLVLLTASLILGIVTSLGASSERFPRFVTAALHRNISLLSVALLAVHVSSAVIDGYVPIEWKDAVVPFVSGYRAFWLGLGAVVLDLLIAITVTSLFRSRLNYRAWKAIHWSAYACWPIALVHGLGMGTDVTAPWMLAVDAGCVAAIAMALGWRINAGRQVSLTPPSVQPALVRVTDSQRWGR